MVGKSVAAFLIVVAFRYPIATALTISASLAQIGEFSFILAELGVGLGLLPEQGRDLILAGAILSIVLNPLMFARRRPAEAMAGGALPRQRISRRSGKADRAGDRARPRRFGAAASPAKEDGPPPTTKLTGHTILVGYGRVGSLVGAALKEAGLPFLVIEDADKTLAQLQSRGRRDRRRQRRQCRGLCRRQSRPAREAADPRHSQRLRGRQVVLRARAANPGIEHHRARPFRRRGRAPEGLGADTVIMGEREIARGIVEEVLGHNPEATEPSAA